MLNLAFGHRCRRTEILLVNVFPDRTPIAVQLFSDIGQAETLIVVKVSDSMNLIHCEHSPSSL